ncbi:MAG: rhomboid family intramembrane serine protease [Deltaproteobacteria bacterium]|nr:rhomboid family intramembrane serine protease [Deltaproteobacteria bacterium]
MNGPGSEALVALGAKIDRLVSAGEWWRLVASMFLHTDVLHLAMNALWLALFGVAAARVGGLGRSLATALLAGALGQTASWLFVAAGSVGASGAAYGLAGLLAVDAWRFRARFPEATRRRLGPGLLAMLAVLLLAPLALTGIDHAAHVGGVVGGALTGLAPPGSRAARALVVLALALFIAAAASAAVAIA